jgi:hypothetical protein
MGKIRVHWVCVRGKTAPLRIGTGLGKPELYEFSRAKSVFTQLPCLMTNDMYGKHESFIGSDDKMKWTKWVYMKFNIGGLNKCIKL